MATSAGQVAEFQADHHRVTRADTVIPSVDASTALVHLWLLLMIVGAVGLLILSIPGPVYEAALALADPTMGGWWAS